MDNSQNSNEKESNTEDFKEGENNPISLNPNVNNSFKINLGKTIYNLKSITNNNLQDNSIESENIFDNKLLTLKVNLKNVRPNKLLVFGLLIYENNKLYSYKVKKFSTKGLSYSKCKRIDAGKFSFLFHDDKPFNERKLNIRFIYNYVMF